jgi:hypothetical protein
MRVGDRARVTYAAATPAVQKVSGARQEPCYYSLGSRAHVMRTRRLHAHLYVFVSTYRWHWYSNINMFVDDAQDDAPLKDAPASWPLCRGSRQPAMPAVRKVSGARQHPITIADSAKALGYLFARLAGSRDEHKPTARTCQWQVNPRGDVPSASWNRWP